MKLAEALPIAERIKTELAPYCSRIEIAGSIRRKRQVVNDIEIVCIISRPMSFWEQVNRYLKIKGKPGAKYTQRVVWLTDNHYVSPAGLYHENTSPWIPLDIFTATPYNWGLIYAIRTGSAGYSHQVLATGWTKKGYHSKEGILYRTENRGEVNASPRVVHVREEHELFDLIGIPYCDPEKREV